MEQLTEPTTSSGPSIIFRSYEPLDGRLRRENTNLAAQSNNFPSMPTFEDEDESLKVPIVAACLVRRTGGSAGTAPPLERRDGGYDLRRLTAPQRAAAEEGTLAALAQLRAPQNNAE